MIRKNLFSVDLTAERKKKKEPKEKVKDQKVSDFSDSTSVCQLNDLIRKNYYNKKILTERIITRKNCSNKELLK